MDGITNLLSKLSLEDIEKLKVLMSVSAEAETKEVITLRVFADEYFNLIKQNRSAAYFTSVNNSFKHLFDFFPSQMSIKSIGLKETEGFLTNLQGKVPKGYRVYARTLKAAFNKAVEWGYIKENYFMKVKLPKKQQVNPAFINSSQLEDICRHIELGGKFRSNDVLRDVVVAGFYTGMRLNEIVNLKWKNVNLSTRIITVGDEDFTTKGRNQRYIPICDEAMEALLRRQNGKGNLSEVKNVQLARNGGSARIIPFSKEAALDGYVFCKSNGVRFTGDYVSRSFQSACRAAGMDRAIHFHSLRHSFASNLVQKGVSLYKIKELLGHSSISTTEIYSHLNLESLREAIKTLDDAGEHSNNFPISNNSGFISSERNSLSSLRIFSLKG